MDVIDQVAKLCRAIRDTLLMLESRIVKSRLPERFQYNIQRFELRDRTSMARVYELKTILFL
jgi:hypothetical protein